MIIDSREIFITLISGSEIGVDTPYKLAQQLSTVRMQMNLMRERHGSDSADYKALSSRCKSLEYQVFISIT